MNTVKRLSTVASLALFALLLSPLGCAGELEEDDTESESPESSEDELKSFVVTERDNRHTVTVTEGQNLLVKLPSNPTSGYRWQVSSSDKTLGRPYKTSFVKNGDAFGAGGFDTMSWKTKDLAGEHSVTLVYKRFYGDPTPVKTFRFKVKIVSK